jgi:hypothetical protein
MEYPTILSMSTWLSLKQETKQALRDIFNIPRSGYVEVFDGRVHSDGTSLIDLMSLTTEAMQEYINSKETDFYVLFNKIVRHIENPELEEEKEVEIIKTKTKTNAKNK